jgi:exodeoxyribonuclease VII small subunit
MSKLKEPTEITFEAGYERLKTIADRIDEEEVPVSEMCNLFAEGKGLERALSDYLDTQQARLEEIERGEGVAAFKIVGVAPSAEVPPDGTAPLDLPVPIASGRSNGTQTTSSRALDDTDAPGGAGENLF